MSPVVWFALGVMEGIGLTLTAVRILLRREQREQTAPAREQS